MKTGYYEMRVFNVGGIDEASTSAMRKEINNRKKKKQEDERRMREMEEWATFHPEVWQSLADKLWDGFVDYKDIPFCYKEIWYEKKN